jgi:predicted PolB exonuclease-like 3'-5' exonuclease
MRIFMDIETVPRSVPAELLTKLQDAQAKRYVKPEIIERKRAETLSKFSLHPFFAQVVCICAHDGAESFQMSTEQEDKLLYEFAEWLASRAAFNAAFCGYNIIGFDLPVLAAAYVANKLPVPSLLMTCIERPFDNTDLMKLFPNAGKLDHIGDLLGIRKSSPHDGSDVANLHEAGRYQDILDHCLDDVRICKAIGEYL